MTSFLTTVIKITGWNIQLSYSIITAMESNIGILKTWPKNRRTCNLGVCPAYHLEKADIEYQIEADRLAREEERSVAEIVPSGTCLVSTLEVVESSRCNVSDKKFVEYFRNQASK